MADSTADKNGGAAGPALTPEAQRSLSPEAQRTLSPEAQRALSPEAQRALAEAEERRRSKAAQTPGAPEVGGRNGPEPTRFGDWEKGGITSDF
jgi:hypothetical protein